MTTVSMTVNGKTVSAPVEGRTLLSAFLRAATASSGSTSAMVMDKSLLLPRRNTVTVPLTPGLVLPTRRGRSETLSMSVPLYLMITSPASTPALAAGEPASTAETRAPRGLPRPMAMSTRALSSQASGPGRAG